MYKVYRRSLRSDSMELQKDVTTGSWVRFTKPTKEELNYFRDLTGVDEDFIEGVMDEFELPRLEKNKYPAILIQIPYNTSVGVKTMPFAIVLTEKNIVTLCDIAISLEKFTRQDNVYTTQKNKFLVLLLSFIDDQYTFFLKQMSKRVKQKKIVLNSLSNKDIIDLVELEDELTYFMSSLVPNANLYESLRRGAYIKFFEEDKDLIEELLISTQQNLDQCRSVIKTVQNIRNAYSTIMTNNLNKTMKLLTLFTILLTIPTIISSIYGMNIPLPLQTNPFAFFYLLGLSVIIIIVLVLLFRRWF